MRAGLSARWARAVGSCQSAQVERKASRRPKQGQQSCTFTARLYIQCSATSTLLVAQDVCCDPWARSTFSRASSSPHSCTGRHTIHLDRTQIAIGLSAVACEPNKPGRCTHERGPSADSCDACTHTLSVRHMLNHAHGHMPAPPQPTRIVQRSVRQVFSTSNTCRCRHSSAIAGARAAGRGSGQALRMRHVQSPEGTAAAKSCLRVQAATLSVQPCTRPTMLNCTDISAKRRAPRRHGRSAPCRSGREPS